MGRRPPGSQGQNRTGESPPSGIAGGPAETWTRVELGPHLAYRQSECWKLSAYSCARRRYTPTVTARMGYEPRPLLSRYSLERSQGELQETSRCMPLGLQHCRLLCGVSSMPLQEP